MPGRCVIGKKIKKAIGSVTKVATLGLVNEKNIGGVASALSGGLLGGAGGLLGGKVDAAAKEAAAQQAAIAQQQEIVRANAAALQANATADNSANVVAGGTAALSDTSTDFKRKRGQSLSSTLGL